MSRNLNNETNYVKGFYFYKNPKTNEVRVVKSLDNDHFIVVKIIPGGKQTVKVWKGDLSDTVKYWNTKPFKPSEHEFLTLRVGYHEVVADAFRAILNAGLTKGN